MSSLEWLGDMAAAEEVPGEPMMADASIDAPSLPIAVSVVSYGIETRLGHRVQNLFEELALEVGVAYLDCRSLRRDPGETVSHWEDGGGRARAGPRVRAAGRRRSKGWSKMSPGDLQSRRSGFPLLFPPSNNKQKQKHHALFFLPSVSAN